MGKNQPHTQVGQQGKGTGAKKIGKIVSNLMNTIAPQFLMPTGSFPQTPASAQPFLPMTPGFAASNTANTDAMMAAQSAYTTGINQIQPMANLQRARLGTDRGYAQAQLDESLAGRGIYDSGIRPYLTQEKIAVPYGRAEQDIGLNAAQQYAALAQQLANAQLAAQQDQMSALLQSAQYAAQNMPGFGYQAPQMPTFQWPLSLTGNTGKGNKGNNGKGNDKPNNKPGKK